MRSTLSMLFALMCSGAIGLSCIDDTSGEFTDTDTGHQSNSDADADTDTDTDTDTDADSDSDAAATEKARWTYLVYMAADNNLEEDYWMDLDEFAAAGSGNGVHVVAQLDRAEGYDTSHGDWTDTRRFYIGEGKWEQIGDSLGELNMGDPETLAGFLSWAAERYPAERYALVLWNHGDSWWSVANDIESDDTLEIAEGELALAFQDFVDAHGPLEAVLFDACLMASWEVAHELQGYAKYMYGSGSEANFDGINHTTSILSIKDDTNATGRELTLVTAQNSMTISKQKNTAAIDISQVQAISDAISDLSATVLADSGLESPLKEAISNARGLHPDWRRYYLDLRDFAEQLKASSNPTMRLNGTAIVEAVDAAVEIALGKTFNHGGTANFGGLNFMADYQVEEVYLQAYTKASWGSTNWGEVLLKMAD